MIQNGDAPGPDDTSDVNGYDFDGATTNHEGGFAPPTKLTKKIAHEGRLTKHTRYVRTALEPERGSGC